MAISFNEVPTNIRVPFVYAEFDASRAVTGPALKPARNLVVGQRLAAGTVAALTPVRVTNAAQAKAWFGAGSQLAAMLAAQLENNDLTETWAIALDDNVAGNAATGSITVGGVTAPGTVNLYLGGRRVQVGVSAADTPADVASNLVDAITALADCRVAAEIDGVAAEQINLTAKNKGEAGNALDIRHSYYLGEELPAGLTLAIVAMTGGTANPDLATVWPAIGDEPYTTFTIGYTDAANLTEIEGELLGRSGPLRQIEAQAYTGMTGTHGALGTFGDTRNSQHLTVVHGSSSPTPPDEIAAMTAGVESYHTNIDPARPLQTLELKGMMPPAATDRFTLQENNLLLYDGISTWYVDAGGKVRIQRLITTYKVNAQGAEDIAYLDVNTLRTLAYLRYDFRNYILRKYPRHKVADDGTRFGPGQAIITPKVGKAEAVARFTEWERLGLVEGFSQFKDDLICERNAQDPNRLDWRLAPDLVNQFRVAGVQIQFLL
ncbi:MAG: phage tail sheath C-terminal domain-containing protein [Thalassobaculaceae bacterium]